MFTHSKNLLVLILFLAACTSPAPKVEDENWVAFSADKAQEDQMVSWMFPGEAEYWSPAETDVDSVEEGLPAFLQENNSAFYMTETLVWERLNEYNRQYIGLVLDGGKIIYANYFCDSNPDWKREFVMVLDGGACYFQFKFDVQTGRYFDLQVNGEA